ncbi:MAG TPA: dCTP deaminase [Xanthobacteraceae bacterium]|nr:dCTP deaminase [Xanthobacteraceae bacterium]
MILTDREISISLDRRLISIEPPPEEIAFTSSAVDLTLDPLIWIVRDPTPALEDVVDPRTAGFNTEQVMRELSIEETINARTGFLLSPRKLALAWTCEYIALRTETRLAARVEGKSSLARLGLVVHMTAPTIHAGFEGRIRLEMMNHGAVPIRLWPGMRICQLIFETTLGTAERGYRGQFAGQTGAKTTKRK